MMRCATEHIRTYVESALSCIEPLTPTNAMEKGQEKKEKRDNKRK